LGQLAFYDALIEVKDGITEVTNFARYCPVALDQVDGDEPFQFDGRGLESAKRIEMAKCSVKG
jgi:hypothetical protein